MYEIMSADEAIRLIRDGDCICVNSFVGIENPTELHEAIYRRYQKMQSPTHLTIVSSAGFGVWDEEHNAEGYIREGAVDKLICGHFGAMMSTKKLVLEDRFEAYNLSLIHILKLKNVNLEDNRMLEFRYDTQLLIEGENLDEDKINEYFTNNFKGDCLLAVGDEELIKIHFHTNEPWKVLEYCSQIGEIYDIVIEDMDRQARGLKG